MPTIQLLLVDDNAGVARLVEEAFKGANERVRLTVAASGAAALEYLQRAQTCPESPLPQLILLDLNMPGMSGREVLAEIKSQPRLQSIPTAILSTSASEQDVNECYRLQANAYLVKPVDFKGFVELANSLTQFWLTWIVPPSIDSR